MAIIATFAGNIGKKPEIRKFDNREESYFSFSVAVNNKKKSGEEETQWVDILYRYNDKLEPYLQAGTKVLITGRLAINAEEANGKTYVHVRCNPYTLELIGQKTDKGGSSNEPQSNGNFPF